MDIKSLSRPDMCTKFFTPALEKTDRDTKVQILEEV